MKKISVFIMLSLLLTACKKNDDPNPPASNTDPKAGSTWVYKFTTYNESGTVVSTSNVTFVGVEVVINGSTWLNMVNQANSQPVIALQKRTDGWWYISYPSTTPTLWFKYPANLNDTYTYCCGTAIVKNLSASVTVPAGTYNNCYMVEGNDTNSLEDEFWFTSSGAVMVKANEYDAKAAGPASNVFRAESFELVSFTR